MAIKSIEPKTVAEQTAEAESALAAKLTKPEGWIIRTPSFRAGTGATVPIDTLNIHPHLVDGVRIEGGKIELVKGQGYTDNEAWAKWIVTEWPTYQVVRVNKNRSYEELNLVKMQRLADIIDGK